MIAAADVQDQELSVGSVGRRVNHPPIAWCGDLGSRSGRDRNPLLIAPRSIGSPKFTYFSTVDRQGQPAFGGNKGNCRRHSGWIVESREGRSRPIWGLWLVTGPGRSSRGTFRAVARRLKSSDQIFEIVDLPRQRDRPLALSRDSLFDLGLSGLALVNERRHAFLHDGKIGQFSRELAVLGRLCSFYARKVSKFDLKFVGLAPHLREHGFERHRGT